MKKTAIAIVCIFFLSSLVLIPLATADWPMFRSDPSHTGVGTGSPVLTPTLLWTFTGDSFEGFSSPAVVNDVVYIGLSGYSSAIRYIWGHVYALNASSGAQLWNYTTGSYVQSSPAVIDGVVYVGSDENFYALNATDGAQLWNFSCNKVGSSPAVVDGVVYFGSFDNNNVYALNATNGDKLWNYPTGGGVGSSPAVVNGVVYIGSNDHNVYALNATNGARLWSYSTDGIVFSSPAVVGGIVYIGSLDHNFYALNASNGDKLWNYTTGNEVYSSPAVTNGVVYMGFGDDNFYALNDTNGAKLWNYTTGSGYSSPVVVAGAVYFSSGDSLYALKATNGDKLWNYTTGGGSSPVVVDGVIYFSSGRVYALGEPYSTTSPRISVLSPLSQTYNDSIVSLVFTLDKPVNWTGYSLDGKQNVTITGNTTITGLSTGLHNITVYAKDLFDNVGASETVVFKAEPFPTALVIIASGASVAIIGLGLLVYFKKRNH